MATNRANNTAISSTFKIKIKKNLSSSWKKRQEGASRRCRANPRQLFALVDMVHARPELLNWDYHVPNPPWDHVCPVLNQLGNAKSAEEWMQTWNTLKLNSHKRLSRWKKYPGSDLPLLDQKVLFLMGEGQNCGAAKWEDINESSGNKAKSEIEVDVNALTPNPSWGSETSEDDYIGCDAILGGSPDSAADTQIVNGIRGGDVIQEDDVQTKTAQNKSMSSPLLPTPTDAVSGYDRMCGSLERMAAAMEMQARAFNRMAAAIEALAQSR